MRKGFGEGCALLGAEWCEDGVVHYVVCGGEIVVALSVANEVDCWWHGGGLVSRWC